jgi:hypothetical protein
VETAVGQGVASTRTREAPGGYERKEPTMNTVIVAPTAVDILILEAARS